MTKLKHGEAKMTIQLQKEEIRAPNGKKIKLKPLLEEISGALSTAPQKVNESMGIPFKPIHVDVKIFDGEGYKKAISERRHLSNRTGGGAAQFFPEQMDILINTDNKGLGGAKVLAGFEGDSNYLGAFRIHIQIALLGTVFHELAHLNHCLYDVRCFEVAKRWNRRLEDERRNKKTGILKDFVNLFRKLIEYFKVARHLTVIEGIASWTEQKMMDDLFAFSEGELEWESKETAKFEDRNPLPSEKLNALVNDPHSLGYWFVDTVANLINGNPIKLVIDHPPRTLGELFNPEYYVRKLSYECPEELQCETPPYKKVRNESKKHD